VPDNIFHQGMEVEDVKDIVQKTLIEGKLVERLLYKDSKDKTIAHIDEIPFYRDQTKIVLHNCGKINPTSIDDYIASGGYNALEKVFKEKISPEKIIDEIKKSNLRGRGGAGFPTGLKWQFTKNTPNKPKYLICNGDEGDPGAFMDRAVLEGDPHSVIEGMLIGAYAIGTEEGYIYVRAEYPIAVEHVKIAIDQARDHGLLGKNILNTGFSFDIKIKQGAGAFVCGEETALMASIEGKRGTPRPRPPFPAQRGLWNKPTCINNVETFANVSHIILRGAEEFAKIGTEKSGGTKIFALAGKVRNTGLIEVPIGTSLRKIIFDIGGGVVPGKEFKAVQIGGPSGGCIPERHLNLPIDYESLKGAGAIMGSGGMIVMDDGTCMVDIARFFMDFAQNESCGKCTPCRIGTKRMLEILEGITKGNGKIEDLQKLEDLAKVVKDSSLCGLGQTVPNPVLSTLRYFKNEYEEHIMEKHCSAAACDALMIAPCQSACPAGINVPKYVVHIAAGEYLEAVETIREKNPFPAICGRICDHPCEKKCRRGELDESVAIRELKRFAADWYFEHETEPPQPFPKTRGQKVAVIGSKNSGKTVAIEYMTSDLSKRGFRIGSIKHVHHPNFTIDTEGRDTWKHAHARAKVVVCVAKQEISIIKKVDTSQYDIDRIVDQIKEENLDVIFWEGFHSFIAKRKDVLKIITAKNSNDLSQRMEGTSQPIIAITGPIAQTDFEGIGEKTPVINLEKEGEQLIQIIEGYLKKSSAQ